MSDGDLKMTVTFSPQVGVVLVKGGTTGQPDRLPAGAQVDNGKTGTVR